MQILLAYKCHQKGASDPFTSLLPVGLPAINAVLRNAGYSCTLANFSGMRMDPVLALLKSEKPSLLGLSIFTHNRHETLELAARAREILPESFIVCGGPHATHRWKELLSMDSCLDAIVLGEGEVTMLELAGALSSPAFNPETVAGLAIRRGGVPIATRRREPMAEIDSLPLPGRFMDGSIGVDSRKQLEFLITSRGCPARCRFCSSPGFWGKRIRFRSPETMVEEIRFLRDHFGLIYFSVRDDTFTADRRRVIDFCRKLLSERIYILWNCQSRVNAVDAELLGWMKRAGCECIQLGIESGSQRMLDLLGKRINQEQVRSAARMVRDVGINLSIYLIAGIPGESEADIEETCRLVADLRPSGGHVSPLVYYPGTTLFDDAVKSGDVPKDLFEKNRDPACQVKRDPSVACHTAKLMDALEQGAARSNFSARDFDRQKGLLGYCHATNLLAGESALACGKTAAAEKEYREIIARESGNPWGWLALAEMYGDAGDLDASIRAFETLVEIVPMHLPAYKALGELYSLTGDRNRSRVHYDRALRMEAGNG